MKGERKLLSRGLLLDGVNVSICARRSPHHSIDCRNGGFSAILQVRPGTHRFHFLIDGEWRISNEFATAVDSEGNLLNYLEASESSDNYEDFQPYSRSDSISCSPLTTWVTIGPEPFVQKDIWTQTIPHYVARIWDTTTYNGSYSRSHLGDDDIMPPALPRQLEKPFLNQNHIQKDDQSVLPHPAHVVTLGDTNCRLY
jgi:5'-AMP-activated protein kinase regulatory beta subunit